MTFHLLHLRLPQLTLIAALLSTGLSGCRTTARLEGETRPLGVTILTEASAMEALNGKVDFVRHIKPILEARCVMCHNDAALPGRMDLSNQDTARRTGVLGLFIVPGQPNRSTFVTRIVETQGHLLAMPPVGATVTNEEMVILRRWIAQGAEWPAGRAGKLKNKG